MSEKEYLLCKVRFLNSYKPYNYLTNDDSLEIGDYAEVFAQGYKTIVEVLEIDKVTQKDTFYNLEKMKCLTGIIKKYDEPISQERPLYLEVCLTEDNNEDISVEDMFEPLENLDYLPLATLDLNQVETFEKIFDLKLPVQYKEMLLKIGNGVEIHRLQAQEEITDLSFIQKIQYKLFNIFSKKENNGELIKKDDSVDVRVIKGIIMQNIFANQRLSRPFNFSNRKQANIREFPFPQFKDCLKMKFADVVGVCDICDHRYECIHSKAENNLDTVFYNGTIEILKSDKENHSYHLILNGPNKGEVWLSKDNENFTFFCKSFKEFLKITCRMKAL
ncbi:MAG: hypothetical protein ACOX1L_04340 [Erysipelotrichaceae bacterium]|jgi:hypothetical protein